MTLLGYVDRLTWFVLGIVMIVGVTGWLPFWVVAVGLVWGAIHAWSHAFGLWADNSGKVNDALTLGLAWQNAESELRPGTRLYLSQNSAGKWGAQVRGDRRTGAGGDTPSEALNALAVRLRAAE